MQIKVQKTKTTPEPDSLFPILGDLSEQELGRLSSVRVVPKGTVVFSQGDKCDALPLLLEGEVRVFKIAENGRELSFSKLCGGQACVLVANCILEDKQFPAFAQAQTDLRVLMIPASILTDFMLRYPSWRNFVWGLMSRCVSSVIDVAEDIVCQPLDKRLARYLLEQQRDGMLQCTHEQIARELNSTREVVSRILKSFERNSLVKLSRGRIAVLDERELSNVT